MYAVVARGAVDGVLETAALNSAAYRMQMPRPRSAQTRPAIVRPLLVALRSRARERPIAANTSASSTSGQAMTPMIGMNENSSPSSPSTKAAVPKPFCGGGG